LNLEIGQWRECIPSMNAEEREFERRYLNYIQSLTSNQKDMIMVAYLRGQGEGTESGRNPFLLLRTLGSIGILKKGPYSVNHEYNLSKLREIYGVIGVGWPHTDTDFLTARWGSNFGSLSMRARLAAADLYLKGAQVDSDEDLIRKLYEARAIPLNDSDVKAVEAIFARIGCPGNFSGPNPEHNYSPVIAPPPPAPVAPTIPATSKQAGPVMPLCAQCDLAPRMTIYPNCGHLRLCIGCARKSPNACPSCGVQGVYERVIL